MCQGLNTPAVQEYLLGLRAFSSSLSCDLYKAFFPIHLFLSLLFFSRGLVSFKPPQIIIYYLDIYYSFFVSLGHYTRSKFSSAYQKPWVAQEQYGRMEWDSYQELCSHSVPK